MKQRSIYQGKYPYFLTTNVKSGVWFFDDKRYAVLLRQNILARGDILGCLIYAFCIMPDHLHILMRTSEQANISKYMQQMKSCTARDLRKNHGINYRFWQERFNFRIIDNNQRLQNTLRYIEQNSLQPGMHEKYKFEPYLYLNHAVIRELTILS